MTRDAKSLLRDLAKHRRDEEALAMRRLAQQLEEMSQAMELLAAEIERGELALRRRIADPFERSVGEGYLAGLRGRLCELREQRDTMRIELANRQQALERRVIRHRQLDRVCELGDQRAVQERGRREELACDDLAAGAWHRCRGGSRAGGAR